MSERAGIRAKYALHGVGGGPQPEVKRWVVPFSHYAAPIDLTLTSAHQPTKTYPPPSSTPVPPLCPTVPLFMARNQNPETGLLAPGVNMVATEIF